MAAPSESWSVSEAQSFISQYFLAWEGTDENLILSFYTDDVVAEIPGTRMEGKEALRDHFVRPSPENTMLSRTWFMDRM